MTARSHKTVSIEWWNVVAGILAWFGILQFLACVYISIQAFPRTSPSGGYSLFEHFLSDLGCRQTEDGLSNATSSAIFNPSVVVLAFAILPFLLNLARPMWQGRKVVQISSLLSVAGLVTIGLTPYDDYFIAHHVALVVWLLPLVVIVLTHFGSKLLQGEASFGLLCVTFVLLATLIGYAMAGSHSGYVLLQKVMAGCAVGWFVFVCGQLGMVTIQTVSSRRQLAEQQAKDYLEHIEQRFRRRTR